MAADTWHPTALHGLGTVSGELGISRPTAEELIRSGLLGEWFTVDGRAAVHAGATDQLATVPMLDPSNPKAPPALVVKVKPAVPVKDEDRPYKGWHADLTPKEQVDGVRGWWTVRNPGNLHGELLVATVAGFVVGTWRIVDHEPLQDTLHRFIVKEVSEDDAAAAFYIGHRMEPVRGGNTLRVPMQG